jgi:predicted MFS family arabinose efflux permease
MAGQFVFTRYVERFNAARMFQIGLVLSVVVFGLYGAANHYLQVIPMQVLLAVCYSALFVGALNYLLSRHRERGTMAGLLNSSMSLSGSLGPFLGGAVSQAWGYDAVMYAAAGLSFLGLLASRGIDAFKKAGTADITPGKA